MKKKYLLLLIHAYLIHGSAAKQITTKTEIIDNQTISVDITIPLADKDALYQDYITFSVDHPSITLSKWRSDIHALDSYDPHFKKNKKLFTRNVTLSFNAQINAPELTDAHIHFNYYLRSEKKMAEKIIPLPSIHTNPEPAYALDTAHARTDQKQPPVKSKTKKTTFISSIKNKISAWSESLSSLIEHAQSTWVRIILVLLLGILLSLTPCIYPMIPITIGVLQSGGSNGSIFKNFLQACSYVAGIASTFALLGLIAAFTGQLFGSFINHPVVTIGIIIIFIYLALSLLGFYNMYIPQSLRIQTNITHNRSLLSTFAFGAITGSIASPCLSPGLILLLSIVTALQSKFLGFILLFFFGIGLGLPLIIIGTFSNSLDMMPRAGSWMVEIKKMFGFMLLATCFFFAKPLLPAHILIYLIALFCLCTGIFYIYDSTYSQSPAWRTFKNIIGIGLTASSLIIGFYGYKATYSESSTSESSTWISDYQTALNKAKQENKKLFVDFSSPHCNVCTAIDKTVFNDKKVIECLKNCIPVKLEQSNTTPNTAVEYAQKKYAVLGFPTFLLINPDNEEVIKQWSSNLYTESNEQFVSEITHLTK